MDKRRSGQIADIIRSVVARYSIEIAPNQATGVSITNVRIADDLRYADVYVSAITGVETAVKILKSRVRDIAKGISKEVSTYAVPLIRFHVDLRGHDLDKLDRLLEKL